jgi:glycosyltransferase involved in cell wall biosynthesis
MGTQTAELTTRTAPRQQACPITVCHFTIAHTQLKSRSFHREFLPLAGEGIGVRYVAPLASGAHRRDGVDFVAHRQPRDRWLRTLAAPALLCELLRQDATLYHFQDPELLPVAFALKLLFRKRIIYDAYEDFPAIAANKRSIPAFLRPLAAKMVSNAEFLAARLFDGVMTADSLTLRRLARRGKSRKLVFYNFPNLDFFPPPRPCAKPFDIVYRGGLSERTGTYVLLDALRLLADRERPARLLLVGYFDDVLAERDLCDRVRFLGLQSSVEIRGRLDHEEMADALSQARIGVSPLQSVPKFLVNLPVKIFEYWACGIPVVASDLPPMRPFFRNSKAGILFEPGSAAALAQSIAWMLDHPAAAAEMGWRGREAVAQRFNNGREVHKLREFCSRIAESL